MPKDKGALIPQYAGKAGVLVQPDTLNLGDIAEYLSRLFRERMSRRGQRDLPRGSMQQPDA